MSMEDTTQAEDDDLAEQAAATMDEETYPLEEGFPDPDA